MITVKGNTAAKKMVGFTELTPGMAHILFHLELFHRTFCPNQELVITSMNDGNHAKLSRHYTNEAVDIRSHNMPDIEFKQDFVKEFEAHLGAKFRVLLEDVGTLNEHIHVQVKKGQVFP